MFLALLSSAHAFVLEEAARWDAPAAPRALVYVARAEGPRLAILGADALRVVDRDTGVAVAEVALGGDALLARDPDGDGEVELWVCAATGLWRVGWTDDTLDAPVRAGEAACGSLVEVPGGLVTAGEAVARWVDDGAGGVTGPEDLGFDTLDGAPLLAWDGTRLAATTLDGTEVQVLDTLGISRLAAGGAVGGLGVVDGGLAWTLPELHLLAWADGDDHPLQPGPGVFLPVDMDGDAALDLVVLHPDEGWLGVLLAGEALEVLGAAAEGAVGLSAVDADGGGCAEVAWLDPAADSVRIVVVADCLDTRDTDGDGWSVDAGDCDDTNGDVHPEATDVCNGIDDDCDGVADLAGLRIDGPTQVDEGGVFELVATADGCGVDVAWTVPALGTYRCDREGERLACEAFDDERVGITAALLDADGVELATASHRLTILNVAPELASSGGGCGGALISTGESVVHPGERYEEQIDVFEPGDDTVRFSGRGLPPGLTISEGGFVVYEVDDQLGTFTPTLRLADEDGGETEHTVTIHVEPEPEGCGSSSGNLCCGGSSAALLMGLSTLLARRRRDA